MKQCKTPFSELTRRISTLRSASANQDRIQHLELHNINLVVNLRCVLKRIFKLKNKKEKVVDKPETIDKIINNPHEQIHEVDFDPLPQNSLRSTKCNSFFQRPASESSFL